MSDRDPWTDSLGFTDLGTEDRAETLAEVKTLIQELHEKHPEVFDDESLTPQEYGRELRDAIFSLGGTFRQGHGADNEDVVRDVFLAPAQEDGHLTYADNREGERIDFKGRLRDTGDTFAMDVKGGEGQSIGHLLVPDNTDILVLWSERNARNTKSPSSRLNEVINRAVRWGFNHAEDPSYIVIRDPPAGAVTDDNRIIPDVVVFPEQFPSPDDPDPDLPTLDNLRFAELLFDVLTDIGDLNDDTVKKHIWWHNLTYSDGRIDKEIRNAWDETISLPTQSIDYSRISDVT